MPWENASRSKPPPRCRECESTGEFCRQHSRQPTRHSAESATLCMNKSYLPRIRRSLIPAAAGRLLRLRLEHPARRARSCDAEARGQEPEEPGRLGIVSCPKPCGIAS